MLPAFSAVSPSGFGMAWAKCIGHDVDSREPQMFLAEQLGDQLGHETLVMSARGTAAEILFKAHKCHFLSIGLMVGISAGGFILATFSFHCQCYLVSNVLPPLFFGN